MFELKTIEKEINGNTYKFRPLFGRHLAPFYDVLSKFTSMKETDGKEADYQEMFKLLDEVTVSKLHKLGFETMKKCYPNEKEEVLDEFVSQNLISFIEPLITVNLPENKQDIKQ